MDNYTKVCEFWKAKKTQTASDVLSILNGKIVNFAFHSGKIENEHITYDDTYYVFDRDRVVNYTGDLVTLQEIKNAKNAMRFFLQCYEKKRVLDLPFILELHELITHDTYNEARLNKGERPGTLKQNDYVIGKDEIGAPAEDTKEELLELLDDISGFVNNGDADVLTAAAFLHAKFENIHPFADGNGRTGRLIMNYFLMQNNHPPVIIFEEEKYKYFQVLDAWHTKQDLEPLKHFLRDETVKTWQHELGIKS